MQAFLRCFPDPMSNAEQRRYLFFFYLVKGMESENAMKSRATEIPAGPPADGRQARTTPNG